MHGECHADSFALVIAFVIKPRFGRPAGEWPRPSHELEHVL